MSATLNAELNETVNKVIEIAVLAGQEILRFYKSDYIVRSKSNNSPVTEADIAADNLIVSGLSELSPELPVISEELEIPEFSVRSKWQRYWLIDPLDGTRSFLRGGDQFTVNIALIEDGYPILGVVHSPVEQSTYWGVVGLGTYRSVGTQGEPMRLRVESLSHNSVKIIASKSRSHKKVKRFKTNLESDSYACEINFSSSSIKFCRVAEGAANIFPNFGPTSEWDTAAAQCVLECAGGKVIELNGSRVRYNKSDPDLKNPQFLALGTSEIDWLRFLPDW